jgi:hypothetical protein
MGRIVSLGTYYRLTELSNLSILNGCRMIQYSGLYFEYGLSKGGFVSVRILVCLLKRRECNYVLSIIVRGCFLAGSCLHSYELALVVRGRLHD